MKSLSRPLNYNENKVKNGDASLLLAANFLEEKEDLNFSDKTNRFERLMKLNARTEKKVVHFSLNFSPEDKISQAELIQIAEEYMDKLGFGEQPYLVYQHYDAAHLHMHIVSTLIKADGKRINTHKIESTKSFQICRELEIKYALVKAEKKEKSRNVAEAFHIFLAMQYGEQETKRGITNVLDHVLGSYNYTSLEEVNAVLGLYNVKADRGPKEGRVYKTGGLYYRVLNSKGEIVGKPIKASSVYNRPTLKFMEEQFALNRLKRDRLKSRVKTSIDWLLKTSPSITLPELINQLKGDGIHVVLRQNEQHLIYGITYVDMRKKVVFNGSDLGKQYAANGILGRIGRQVPVPPITIPTITPSPYQAEFPREEVLEGKGKQYRRPILGNHHSSKVVYPGEYLPFELKTNKKKRKRRRLK